MAPPSAVSATMTLEDAARLDPDEQRELVVKPHRADHLGSRGSQKPTRLNRLVLEEDQLQQKVLRKTLEVWRLHHLDDPQLHRALAKALWVS
jgi:hypothetical protein